MSSKKKAPVRRKPASKTITTLEQALIELGLSKLTNGDIALNLSRIDQIDPVTGHTAENKRANFTLVTLEEVNTMLENMPHLIKMYKEVYSEAEAGEVIQGQRRVQQAYEVIRTYLMARAPKA